MSDTAEPVANTSAPPKIRFRYTKYGNQFRETRDFRLANSDPESLCENEVAVDVGNVCWNYQEQQRRILDHHFEWENGCPSAAVAVLYHVDALASWANEVSSRPDFPGEFWITTHHNPDFDAYCSANLVRWVLRGELLPRDIEPLNLTRADFGSGNVRKRIDWFSPRIPARITANGRVALLLAAVASCVDQCRRMTLPREYQLHSVLYAAARRGRSLTENGAADFFEYVRERIQGDDLNPLIDLIFDPEEKAYSFTNRDKRHPFTNEVEMLRREPALYRSDLARARRIYVQVPMAKVPFNDWFAPLRDLPFFVRPGEVDPLHLSPPDQQRSKVEGVFLRDPHSLLFKEWVREDREHTISEQGTLFTAIAYSNERDGAKGNSTKYIFALDPERAQGRHLYPLWARLQEAELKKNAVTECPEPHRLDFQGRKVGQDPWFDGNNFEATIIDTPNEGTSLKPGTSVDLSDTTAGTVEAIVRQALEFGWYLNRAQTEIWDYPADDDSQESKYAQVSLPQAPCPQAGMFRFALVELDEETATDDPKFAVQLARDLWPLLQEEPTGATQVEPAAEHVVAGLHEVTVWNRNGVVAASRGKIGRTQMEALHESFRRMAELQQGINRLLQLEKGGSGDSTDKSGGSDLFRLREGANLSRLVTALELEAAKPEGLALQRFLASTRFQNVLRSLHSLNESAASEAHARTLQEAADEVGNNVAVMKSMQTKVEYVEIFLIGIYSIYLVNYLGEALEFNHWYRALCLVLGPVIASFIAGLMLEPWKHASADHLAPSGRASATTASAAGSLEKSNEIRDSKSPRPLRDTFAHMFPLGWKVLCLVGLYVVGGLFIKIHLSHENPQATQPTGVVADAGAKHELPSNGTASGRTQPETASIPILTAKPADAVAQRTPPANSNPVVTPPQPLATPAEVKLPPEDPPSSSPAEPANALVTPEPSPVMATPDPTSEPRR